LCAFDFGSCYLLINCCEGSTLLGGHGALAVEPHPAPVLHVDSLVLGGGQAGGDRRALLGGPVVGLPLAGELPGPVGAGEVRLRVNVLCIDHRREGCKRLF